MKNDTREIIAYEAMSGISVTHENAPCRYPAHWHNSAEFTVVLKDGCRYMIGDVEYRAKKGDILLVWPREIHEIISREMGIDMLDICSSNSSRTCSRTTLT